MNIHPYANLIPAMSSDEFDRLAEDIQANGLLEPIVTFEGGILDGRHRYWACQQTNTPIRTVEYSGVSPLTYVVSKNVQRRHLTAAQRAALAAELLPQLGEELLAQRERGANGAFIQEDGSRPSGQQDERRSTVRAAKAVGGVDRAAVQVAKKAKAEKPEVFDRMRAGKITVAEAHRELHPPKPKAKPSLEKKNTSSNGLGSVIAGLTWEQAATNAQQAISHLADVTQTVRMNDPEDQEDSLQTVDQMIADLNWVRSLVAGETESSIETLEKGDG